ncbi:MAG TPA: hypothetical protein VFP35_02235 [Candidatus Saccharimonadales bacterium]|nr:hypothetical protein [Candidatus Saccharimonadales bacterium]
MRSPENHNLNGHYQRRARLAALAAGLSLFGGVVEMVRAEGALAQPEQYQLSEQTPRAFIRGIDKKLIKVGHELRASRKVKEIKGKTANLPKGIDIYYISTPGSKARHYNILSVTVKDGMATPLITAIDFNANARTPARITNSPEGIIVSQVSNPSSKFTPNTIEMFSDHGVYFEKYSASVTNFDGNHPPFGRSTSGNYEPTSSSVVSGEFNSFIKEANQILEDG